MGWFWSTTSTPPSLPNSSTLPSPSPPTDPPSQSPPTTPDTDPEITYLLSLFEAETRPSSTKYNRVPASSSSPSSTTPTNTPRTPTSKVTKQLASGESLQESLLPTTMSCREAFDSAFYCQSLGGQFNNLYRYGGIKDCGAHWGAFWFCMKANGRGGDEGERLIKEHYRKRLMKYKVGPSSEDVWEARTERLEWGEAFSEGVDEREWAGSGEEWNQRERERRERRVEGMEGQAG